MPGPKPRIGCLVEDCQGTHYAKGYCNRHYGNFNRCGDPLGSTHNRPGLPNCECGKRAISRSHKLCKACYQRWWYANRLGVNPMPERHKAEPNYGAAHYRVRAARGHASGHDCVVCFGQAEEWALSADATDLRYGESATGRGDSAAYSLNVYSYLPMCKKCHLEYDAEARGHTYKNRPVSA